MISKGKKDDGRRRKEELKMMRREIHQFCHKQGYTLINKRSSDLDETRKMCLFQNNHHHHHHEINIITQMSSFDLFLLGLIIINEIFHLLFQTSFLLLFFFSSILFILFIMKKNVFLFRSKFQKQNLLNLK